MSITVADIYSYINEMAPFDRQESWDNSGFLVGDSAKEVKKIALALDVTNDTLRQAAEFGADLMVSHHPVIFDPLKNVHASSPVYYAIEHGISIISAHTCWDVAEGGVNDVLASLLRLEDVTPVVPDSNGICMLRMGSLKNAVPSAEFAEIAADTLDTVVRMTLPDKMIKTVAVCGGAGASLLSEVKAAGADAYVTGDAKHNDFLDAIDLDISLIAAGHYETETVSVPVMLQLLKHEFPELDYKYIESAPVTYVG